MMLGPTTFPQSWADAFRPPDSWYFEEGRWLPIYNKRREEDYAGKSYSIPPGPGSSPFLNTEQKESKKAATKEDDYDKSMFRNLFLMAALDSMQGKSPQPAPVVTGGPAREFPSMARMMTPMEQQKPYWWVSRSV